MELTPVRFLGVVMGPYPYKGTITLIPILMVGIDGAAIPIGMGNEDARRILAHANGEVYTRPLTHQLFFGTMSSLGATVEKGVITELKENPKEPGLGHYRSVLVLRKEDEVVEKIDARPSDIVTLSLIGEFPLFCESGLFREMGVPFNTLFQYADSAHHDPRPPD